MNMIVLKEKLKKIYHILQRKFKFYRRFGLKNKSFTIISNNCTAGYVYQYFGLPYRTPTAGVFFEASDFVKLVKNPLFYFDNTNLQFIDPSESKNIKLFQNSNNWGNYPVALLKDIEIYFMHYQDQKSAEKIWKRRSQRINMNNILFLFTENESFTKQVIDDYLSININKNKLCFVNSDYGIINNSLIRDTRAAAGGGNYSWTPEIILTAINWKKFLNELILK